MPQFIGQTEQQRLAGGLSQLGDAAMFMRQNQLKKAEHLGLQLTDIVTSQFGGDWALAYADPNMKPMIDSYYRNSMGLISGQRMSNQMTGRDELGRRKLPQSAEQLATFANLQGVLGNVRPLEDTRAGAGGTPGTEGPLTLGGGGFPNAPGLTIGRDFPPAAAETRAGGAEVTPPATEAAVEAVSTGPVVMPSMSPEVTERYETFKDTYQGPAGQTITEGDLDAVTLRDRLSAPENDFKPNEQFEFAVRSQVEELAKSTDVHFNTEQMKDEYIYALVETAALATGITDHSVIRGLKLRAREWWTGYGGVVTQDPRLRPRPEYESFDTRPVLEPGYDPTAPLWENPPTVPVGEPQAPPWEDPQARRPKTGGKTGRLVGGGEQDISPAAGAPEGTGMERVAAETNRTLAEAHTEPVQNQTAEESRMLTFTLAGVPIEIEPYMTLEGYQKANPLQRRAAEMSVERVRNWVVTEGAHLRGQYQDANEAANILNNMDKLYGIENVDTAMRSNLGDAFREQVKLSQTDRELQLMEETLDESIYQFNATLRQQDYQLYLKWSELDWMSKLQVLTMISEEQMSANEQSDDFVKSISEALKASVDLMSPIMTKVAEVAAGARNAAAAEREVGELLSGIRSDEMLNSYFNIISESLSIFSPGGTFEMADMDLWRLGIMNRLSGKYGTTVPAGITTFGDTGEGETDEEEKEQSEESKRVERTIRGSEPEGP